MARGWLTGSGRAGASAPRGGPSSGPRRSLSPPGDRYWVFKDNNVEEGYPRPVSDFGLPPGGIDAAFSWAHNDKTYFFKDQLYWRFDEHTRRMDPGHPARSPPWRGIPSTLDDAMRWSDGEPHAASASPPVKWGSQWACAPTDPQCTCVPPTTRGRRYVQPPAASCAPGPLHLPHIPQTLPRHQHGPSLTCLRPTWCSPTGRGENTSPSLRGS